jgi:hypothetical protein
VETAFTPVLSGSSLVSSINSYNMISTSSPNNLPPPNAYSLDMHGTGNDWNASDTNPLFFANTAYWSAAYATSVSNAPNNGCGQIDLMLASWQTSGVPTCSGTDPYSGPFVNEILIEQTSATPGSGSACSSAPCAGSQTIVRLGNCYLSEVSWEFGGQNCTISVPKDGFAVLFSSDLECTIGRITNSGAAICGGINWQKSHGYTAGDVITPSAGNASNYTYQAPSGCTPATCITAATAPTWTNSTVADGSGGTAFSWNILGAQTMRGADVFLAYTQPPAGATSWKGFALQKGNSVVK